MLKVADLNVVDNYVPSPDTVALLAQDPAPPAETLLAMLRHRVVASGAPGTGTVTIQNASVHQVDGTLTGAMTVDVSVSSPDGRSTGYAEATVSASRSAPDQDDGAGGMQAALYGLTKQLMENMNVQLQYQMQHNLSGWLSWSPTPGRSVHRLCPRGAGGRRDPVDAADGPAGVAPGAPAAPQAAPAYPAPAAPPPAYPEPQQNLIPPGYPGASQ